MTTGRINQVAFVRQPREKPRAGLRRPNERAAEELTTVENGRDLQRHQKR